MSLTSLLLLFAGGVLAGCINVMAGGAGFMTFPLLIAAGLSEMEANAANFVALLPANVMGTLVYAKELKEVRQNLVLRLVIAVVGGVAGSLLFLHLGEANFHRAIPWLLVFATLSFALGPTIKTWLESHGDFDASRWLWLSFVLEFLVYLYGGYFGLGMGIMLLAIHSIFSHMSVHHANALRNITIGLMTFFSIFIFAQGGLIRWLPSLVMMTGAVVGGYGMAKIARRVPAGKVRIGILCWSIALTAFSFWRYS
ncbi:sulfite exporter TauE/SafE family protein [Aestuariivirga litoralis]|uniref:sulfite exporter TauE/SafE family protein n=1 Tax=Aestuariivirga litoralis TaxID=2650924 RepID=UPI0018C6601B|nr:sulfite exporter TauE/SafE family protein [Aestuariivirga litoralis]